MGGRRIVFAALALCSGCADLQDHYFEDMAACSAKMPQVDPARISDPAYVTDSYMAEHAAYLQEQKCWERTFLAAERRDAATAAALGSLRNAGDSMQATGNAWLNRPRPVLSMPPPAPLPSPPPPDLYAVQRAPVGLFSPEGPTIGQTSRIGGTPPSIVVVPAPPVGLFRGTDTTP
jgi:hypothetical protein